MPPKKEKAKSSIEGKNVDGTTDIRTLSKAWKWSAIVDGKSIGGPYQLAHVIRQLDDQKVKEATITFDYKA